MFPLRVLGATSSSHPDPASTTLHIDLPPSPPPSVPLPSSVLVYVLGLTRYPPASPRAALPLHLRVCLCVCVQCNGKNVQAQPKMQMSNPHTGPVLGCSWAGGGNKIYTVSADKTGEPMIFTCCLMYVASADTLDACRRRACPHTQVRACTCLFVCAAQTLIRKMKTHDRVTCTDEHTYAHIPMCVRAHTLLSPEKRGKFVLLLRGKEACLADTVCVWGGGCVFERVCL